MSKFIELSSYRVYRNSSIVNFDYPLVINKDHVVYYGYEKSNNTLTLYMTGDIYIYVEGDAVCRVLASFYRD